MTLVLSYHIDNIGVGDESCFENGDLSGNCRNDAQMPLDVLWIGKLLYAVGHQLHGRQCSSEWVNVVYRGLFDEKDGL